MTKSCCTLEATNLHSSNEEFQLRLVFLLDNVEVYRINGNSAVHVDLELVDPPKHLRRTCNVHGGVEDHLPSSHVGEEPSAVVSQLDSGEPSRELKDLARFRRLRAGEDLGGAEERAVVEDRHGGGGVFDGCDVGVSDVDGQDEFDV
eukprot:TRINITY_DN1376_c0_g1_i7.p2 TRINITY_DN1376_c0_g1~~TRINITY_DN1376_c0_g1_i7.p2  ORF type:complete len:147 (-),score=14.12 TRINITY_DN1376_c0_g1_i7:213-653(-)